MNFRRKPMAGVCFSGYCLIENDAKGLPNRYFGKPEVLLPRPALAGGQEVSFASLANAGAINFTSIANIR
jgi:hypothetical protein